MRAHSLLVSFRYAFAGIGYVIRTQRNFRLHLLVSACVIGMGVWLHISLDQWAILAVMMALVLHAELVNTALEAVVDKASPEIHPLAKIAKDCAAGAVLITALLAVLVGLLILGPPLLAIIRHAFST